MRLRALVVLAALTACRIHNYKVGDPKAQPTIIGISAYPTAVVEVAVAPGIEVDRKDISSLTEAVVERVRAVKVIADVRPAPADADLAIRVRITKMEHKESWSLQHGTTEWYDASADVDLYDARRASSLDHFSLSAGPGGRVVELPHVVGPEPSLGMYTLMNVAYGIAGELKRRK